MNPNTLSREQYKNLTNAWSIETALPLPISEHDIVFWFGDLNYRIHEIISTQIVFDTVLRGDFKSLLYKDQLIDQRLAGNVFEDYDEGSIDFEPTYKYQPGTSLYDNRSEKKLR
jgi:phosphatidylinositol-bisphosphatase